MITFSLLWLFYSVTNLLLWPITILDDVSVDSGFGAAISNLLGDFANLNGFLPLDSLFSVIGIILAIELVIAGYKIIMWVIRRFPTQS